MKPNEPNQGEGDRDADRHYRNDVREFISKGKVESAAKDARDFVERDPEGARRAERAAKRGTRVSVDQLIAKGRSYIERIRERLTNRKGK